MQVGFSACDYCGMAVANPHCGWHTVHMETMTTLTVEDYRVLPETGPNYQLIEGDLIKMAPAPNRYHQTIALNVAVILRKWLESGSGEGHVFMSPFDVYLDNENVLQPDVLYIRPENSGILTDAGCKGAPDLVVEVLSPGTRAMDLGPKKKIFAREGVVEMWVIDPEPRTLDVYRFAENVDAPAEHLNESDTFGSELLPGLEIACSKVFAE